MCYAGARTTIPVRAIRTVRQIGHVGSSAVKFGLTIRSRPRRPKGWSRNRAARRSLKRSEQPRYTREQPTGSRRPRPKDVLDRVEPFMS
jgi:hypothetical protein